MPSKTSRRKNKQAPVEESSKSSQQNTNVSDSNTIYFWKPEDDYGYLGQWYPSAFTLVEGDGSKYVYENAEQLVLHRIELILVLNFLSTRFMMHRKGMLFAPDSPITAAILETIDPRDIKALGRKAHTSSLRRTKT
ncbi:hypothetical protein FRC12_020799 [Ceratobasidium sp. 428]|nr:hypothetical protein FRC12_020799 [Ceratobasidium sp. 428]